MSDKKLTDAEIINIKLDLENHINFSKRMGSAYSTISITKLENILDLINRLQAKIEKCEKVEHFADKTISTLQAENKNLQERNVILRGLADTQKAENERLKRYYYQHEYDKWEKEIKAEAYKECIEKVKEISKYETYCDNRLPAPIITYHITEDKLDNLLKELVGENNE